MNTSACAVLCLKADVAAEVKAEFLKSLCAGLFLQGSNGIVAPHSWQLGNNLFIPYTHGHAFSSPAMPYEGEKRENVEPK